MERTRVDALDDDAECEETMDINEEQRLLWAGQIVTKDGALRPGIKPVTPKLDPARMVTLWDKGESAGMQWVMDRSYTWTYVVDVLGYPELSGERHLSFPVGRAYVWVEQGYDPNV